MSVEQKLTQICDEADFAMKVASWMIENGFATGHGDNVDDLLKELTWQIKELKEQNWSYRKEEFLRNTSSK